MCWQTVQILWTKRGEGVKKSQNYVDVVYGSPIPPTISLAYFPALPKENVRMAFLAMLLEREIQRLSHVIHWYSGFSNADAPRKVPFSKVSSLHLWNPMGSGWGSSQQHARGQNGLGDVRIWPGKRMPPPPDRQPELENCDVWELNNQYLVGLRHVHSKLSGYFERFCLCFLWSSCGNFSVV